MLEDLIALSFNFILDTFHMIDILVIKSSYFNVDLVLTVH